MNSTIHQFFLAAALGAFIQSPASAAGCKDHQAMEAQQVSEESVYNVASEWTNQTGEKISITNLGGKPRLVSMGFTSCQTACPMLVGEMKSIASKLTPAQQEQLGLTLFSIDSKRDTPEALRGFQKKMKIETPAWSLLQSDSASVNELAAVLGIQFKPLSSGDFVHSNVILLLNEKGEVVARKEGLKTSHDDFLAAVRRELK